MPIQSRTLISKGKPLRNLKRKLPRRPPLPPCPSRTHCSQDCSATERTQCSQDCTAYGNRSCLSEFRLLQSSRIDASFTADGVIPRACPTWLFSKSNSKKAPIPRLFSAATTLI